MISRLMFLILGLAAVTTTTLGAPAFSERMPAYFVDRYGYPKTSKNVRKIQVIREKHGSISISGDFSVREFRSGDLRVRATFGLPSIKLVSVWLQLPRQWTDEQLEAALTAYGSGWRLTSDGLAVKVWTNPEGLKAIHLLTSLEIQSPVIVSQVNQELAKKEVGRKAVPKF